MSQLVNGQGRPAPPPPRHALTSPRIAHIRKARSRSANTKWRVSGRYLSSVTSSRIPLYLLLMADCFPAEQRTQPALIKYNYDDTLPFYAVLFSEVPKVSCRRQCPSPSKICNSQLNKPQRQPVDGAQVDLHGVRRMAHIPVQLILAHQSCCCVDRTHFRLRPASDIFTVLAAGVLCRFSCN